MKKHNLFVSLGMALLMGTSLFLTSCSEDPKAGPTVNIIAEAGYISADATVAPGDSVKIKINIVEGDGSISKVDFTRDGTSLSGYPKTEDVAAGNMVLATAAPSNVGTYTYDIIITDKNDQTQTVSIKITVAASAGAIDSWSAQTMGGAASTNGSYYASATGVVYKSADIAAHKAEIDLVFDFVTSNATFLSPSTSSSITGGNVTKFGAVSITAAQFDAMTDDSEIAAIAPAASSIQVAAGTVYGFETASGKKGLIKVVSVTSPDCSIAVKVQK